MRYTSVTAVDSSIIKKWSKLDHEGKSIVFGILLQYIFKCEFPCIYFLKYLYMYFSLF